MYSISRLIRPFERQSRTRGDAPSVMAVQTPHQQLRLTWIIECVSRAGVSASILDSRGSALPILSALQLWYGTASHLAPWISCRVLRMTECLKKQSNLQCPPLVKML